MAKKRRSRGKTAHAKHIDKTLREDPQIRHRLKRLHLRINDFGRLVYEPHCGPECPDGGKKGKGKKG
jgi:hypothetical protein